MATKPKCPTAFFVAKIVTTRSTVMQSSVSDAAKVGTKQDVAPKQILSDVITVTWQGIFKIGV